MSVKVYFGGLSEGTSEESFRKLLDSQLVGVSESESVWIKPGYGFALYDGEESANEAIAKFNGFVHNGLTMIAEVAKDSDKRKSTTTTTTATAIRISNVPSADTQKTLEPILSKYGEVETIEFVALQDAGCKSVTVTYRTEREAEEAVIKLNEVDFEGTEASARAVTAAEKVEAPAASKRSASSSSIGGGGGDGGGGERKDRPSPVSSTNAPQQQQRKGVDFPLRMLVQSEMVGAIIGKGGQTIRQITQQSRARVDVHRKENVGSLEKAITIYGQPDNCSNACLQIMKVMRDEAKNTGKLEDVPLKILAHNNLVGRIIGKQGATIKRIMNETDTKITVSSINEINSFNVERIITVRGDVDGVVRAETEISAKLRAAYEGDVQAMAPQLAMYHGIHPSAAAATFMGPFGIQHGYQNSFGAAAAAAAAMGGFRGHAPHQLVGHPVQSGNPYYAPGPFDGMVGQNPMHADGSGLVAAMAGMTVRQQHQPVQEVVSVFIPSTSVGAVIGTKGTYIREIIRLTGANIKIAPNDETGAANGGDGDANNGAATLLPAALAGTRRVTIVGTSESQHKAQLCIWEKVEEDQFAAGSTDFRWHLEISVPSVHVGRIIGRSGANVRELQRKTGTMIKLPEEGVTKGEETPVLIIGPANSVWLCQARLRDVTREAVVVSNPIPPHVSHGYPVNGSSSGQQPDVASLITPADERFA